MKVDYIIVGLGLAGIALAERLEARNKSFVVFDDESQHSSRTAAGAYNPVILKRFTPVWNGPEQIEVALPFYQQLAEKLKVKLDFPVLTKKVFKSIEDQNNWFAASDKPRLQDYLDPKLDQASYEGVIAEFGFGNVRNTGWIDTNVLLDHYRLHLQNSDQVRFETFEYEQLDVKDGILYKDIKAEKIVFCEGYGITKNPYFRHLPLNGTKGEVLIIEAPELDIDFQVKSTIFVLPLGNHRYKVGATFNWADKTSDPTEAGKSELLEKLKKVITVPFNIVNHRAGIRPTVKDRRPLVGIHPDFKNVAIMNGLGTRGVMIAPTVSEQLLDHIDLGTPLDPEIDINRF
ncbi:MAG: FAD-dependent oxidoreductase [Flavobacteriaceae bacterium]|nr:FAD-dependent oxidoreductase [Flavobacteriaceae bacterium]